MIEVGQKFKYHNKTWEIMEIRQLDFLGAYKYQMVTAIHNNLPDEILVLELPIELVCKFTTEE